jgi:hypothetical protein
MKKSFFRFKDLFLGLCFGLGPFFLLGGILSIFRIIPIYYNETPHYGFAGLIGSIMAIPIFSLIFSFTAWVTLNIGVFMQNLFIKPQKRS